jgi:glucose-6-phosphate 1-dehydrogenase
MSRQGRLPQEFALVGVARTQMSGALRDMIQNHLLQVMCVIAMEPPSTFDAESVRIANRDIRCSRVHCRQLALAGRAVLCAHGQTHGATHKFSDTALQAAATLDLRRPTTASEHSDDPDTVDMDFCYTDHFGGRNSAAYEPLILNCLVGDGTLFASRDWIERSWELLMPIMEAWNATSAAQVPSYAAGTWGPAEAQALSDREWRQWEEA